MKAGPQLGSPIVAPPLPERGRWPMTRAASIERPTAVHDGASAPLGAMVTRVGVNFSVFSKHATGIDLLLFDHVDAAAPSRAIAVDPVTGPQLPLLACVRARAAGRADLRVIARTVRSTRSGRSASTRARCCSIRTAAPSSCLPATTAAAARQPGDNAATAMKSVVVDSERLRLGRRSPAASPIVADDRVRDARARVHAASRAPACRRARAARTPG